MSILLFHTFNGCSSPIKEIIRLVLMPSCQWKTLVPFFLWKEKTLKCTFNINSELSQNRPEKQIMIFKITAN